ncbi:MAG: HD-like signal output (HDOD) protein, partial [Halioglobus sp.]
MNQHEQFYEEILAELKSGKLVLPVLPDVALKVTDIANCPLYRGRNPVYKVQTALTRLGLKMVKNLVSSLVLEQMFQAPSKNIADQLQELWQHSADVAA